MTIMLTESSRHLIFLEESYDIDGAVLVGADIGDTVFD